MPTISPRDMNRVSSTVAAAPKPVAVAAALGEVRQPDTVDASAKPPEVQQPDPLALKTAELAKRERVYAQRRKELDERDAQLKSREAGVQSAEDFKTSLKGRITQAPLETLSELGLTYDQLTNLILNQPKPEDLQFQQLQTEMKALKAANEQTVAQIQQQKQDSYKQAVNQIRNEVKLLVDANADFETIKETGSHEAVVALIEETFKEEGMLLTVEDASKEVEEFLMKEALKMAGLKKVQAKLKPVDAPQTTLADAKASAAAPMKTITNNVSHGASKPLSDKERRERAIMAFQGKLQA